MSLPLVTAMLTYRYRSRRKADVHPVVQGLIAVLVSALGLGALWAILHVSGGMEALSEGPYNAITMDGQVLTPEDHSPLF